MQWIVGIPNGTVAARGELDSTESAVFGESIANPALVVLDFEKFAKAAHKHGVPFIVDNTFATDFYIE